MANVEAGTARILLDLKPAFDGFAGIPQETRLLFRGLRAEQRWHVKGLIQHGSRHLRPGLDPRRPADVSQQIYQLSQLIVSVNARPHSTIWDIARDRANRYLELELLRARSALGMQVPSTVFDSRLFPDFVWRTFFEKTLNARDKDAVVADDYYVIQPPRNAFHKAGLRRSALLLSPRYPAVDTTGFDFFVAQTPFPGRVSKKTRLVVRYHDAVPLLMPHTIKDKAFHQATHYQALRSNIASGAKFVCISEASRRDLLTIFPEIEKDTFVIHNMVSEEYFEDDSAPDLVPRLIKNRVADVKGLQPGPAPEAPAGADFEYLLMVSTIEPRKNHTLLVSAWERLKYTTHPHLKLVVVGSIGWDEDQVLKAFRPWVDKGDLFYLQNVPSAELRVLYKHARMTVCPSLGEGFDYAGVEAMRCGCPVAASDIPVHREIYQNASCYFNPYSVEDAANLLSRVLAPGARHELESLKERGGTVAAAYLPTNILPKWREFFCTASSSV